MLWILRAAQSSISIEMATFVAPTIPSGGSVSNDAMLTFQLIATDPNMATDLNAAMDTDTVSVRVFLKGDVNRNNTVNAVDLGQVRANFGRFLNP
jgi:hypothetical protein